MEFFGREFKDRLTEEAGQPATPRQGTGIQGVIEGRTLIAARHVPRNQTVKRDFKKVSLKLSAGSRAC